jgi:hypothetical protein
MLITILVVLVILSLAGGAFGGEYLGPGPYRRWSPLGIVLVILLVLWLFGGLDLGHAGHWGRRL